MSILSLTENFGFNLIDFASQTWHTDEYNNWRKLDALLNGQLDNEIPFINATGAVNTYVLTFNPAITSYTNGLIISFSPNLSNTGAATVNVNGLGAKALVRNGIALVGGELIANDYVKAIYDGTRFSVIQPIDRNLTIPNGTITPAKLSTGAAFWDSSGNHQITGSFGAGSTIISGNAFLIGSLASNRTVFSHSALSSVLPSAQITYSTLDPSGGSDGDLWFKYTP